MRAAFICSVLDDVLFKHDALHKGNYFVTKTHSNILLNFYLKHFNTRFQ